jgi:hypothetical protein
MDSLGQVVGGPVVGALATMSLRAALVVTGVMLAPALGLYVRAARQLPGRATFIDKACGAVTRGWDSIRWAAPSIGSCQMASGWLMFHAEDANRTERRHDHDSGVRT